MALKDLKSALKSSTAPNAIVSAFIANVLPKLIK